MTYYAHTPRPGSDRWHILSEHLQGVARLARQRAEKFGTGDLAYAAGLIHDLGKFNPAFQQRLRDLHANREANKVQHAVFGALYALDHGMPQLFQMLAGHHSGREPLRRYPVADPVRGV